jgi:hypothetical protein
MNVELAFRVLKSKLLSASVFNKNFADIKFHEANLDFPRSVTAYYENEYVGGEITIYIIPENSYCEYEMLIAKNEQFYSEKLEFNSENELANIINKYSSHIASMCI